MLDIFVARIRHIARLLRPDGMSAFARFADSSRISPEVREVPIPVVSRCTRNGCYEILTAAASLAPDARRLDDGPPQGHVGLEQDGEFIGRRTHCDSRNISKPLSHLWMHEGGSRVPM